MHNRATARPVTLPHPAMPDADWADAFVIAVDQPDLTAPKAARHVIDSAPAWYHRLLALRNIIVKPLGLKTDLDTAGNAQLETIGVFPLIRETDTCAVLGLDDHHLNFRIVIETEPLGPNATLVRSITLIRRNNGLGHAYLAAVMPFHNRIVPAMLNAAYGS
ncbi:DUF2867 domain-containing protein [Thalassospira australica]|uniref:DUF2867 domain-containing protein n=1 Tax=Thalassospira australica TaxID=1528106 RepID=UPI00051A6957|nr:DUF2867 domain-containing protein [Thalassospira australica]